MKTLEIMLGCLKFCEEMEGELSKTVFRIGDCAPGATSVKSAVFRFISELPMDRQWVITIEPYKRNRSAAQNALMWKWNTEIGDHLGYTKDEVHEILKEKIAVPILVRDDKEYAKMVSAVKDVRRANMNDVADNIKREIIRMTSTTRFNVKQMTEYLNGVEQFAAEHGAELTFPDDLMYEALGMKK